jgi:hypothetical protein
LASPQAGHFFPFPDLRFPAMQLLPIHKTLRMSPAMALGVTDRLWEISDLVALLEEFESLDSAA